MPLKLLRSRRSPLAALHLAPSSWADGQNGKRPYRRDDSLYCPTKWHPAWYGIRADADNDGGELNIRRIGLIYLRNFHQHIVEHLFISEHNGQPCHFVANIDQYLDEPDIQCRYFNFDFYLIHRFFEY
ncbi:hypothetical protein ColLi_05517 [Colletotrichum liriopes]|uniref:Uncharacterized protein n=1 Tax=Colletotrichum liriopes TaxID=708192 RepID=A0AA37GKG0_9PEZI|nr:hypothetical protein ColLi_05517 [Colletotrichum liriopes]